MIWAVAIGGALGSVSRFLLSGVIQRASGMTFPVWTLLINVAGSVILGFLMRFAVDGAPLPATTRAFLTTGFCGGFTTFSTFSYESVSLVEAGDWMRGSGYVVASVVLSLGGALAGMMAAHALAVARSGAAAG